MIPSSAIKGYLNRKLDSHLWVKGLTAKELDEALSQLRPCPTLSPKNRLHQRACFLLGVAYPKFCFFLEMGLGKTLIVLELLRYWFQCGRIKRVLVFVTSDKAFPTWEKQFERFGIKLPVTALAGSSEQKWAQLEEFGDGVVLLPYPGALYMVSTRQRNKKGKNKQTLNNKLVAKLSNWAEAIVLDESTKVAGGDSLTNQLMRKLRKRATIRYALAGRPFGDDPIMLWEQCNIIDDGETLGETKGLFRSAFYTEKSSFWGGPYSKEYTFKPKMKSVLSKMIQHRSITYSSDECIDLPKVTPIQEFVPFPEETQAYYKRVVENIIAARGNLREVKNGFLRMRQLSSGFVGLKDDETGEKAEIEFTENPKLERLLELVNQVPEGHGCLIWYEFTVSGRKIVKELKSLGYKPMWLWSGTKDARKELARFEKEPFPIGVIQTRVGSLSLDGLQHSANYDFEFEATPSLIDFSQARKRLHRDGQKHPVFQYSFGVLGNSADEKIHWHRESGQDFFKAVIKDPARALGL